MNAPRDILIVCVNGGKTGGQTERMLYEMSAGCEQVRDKHPDWHASVTTYIVHLAKQEWEIPFLINPEKQRSQGAIGQLLELFTTKADGLILATPVRWGNMSALMLRFLEWLYFLEQEEGWPLRGIPVGYGACGQIDGGQAAINAMQNTMMHLKCVTIEDGHFYRIESLMPHAASDPELRWMIEDAPLVGLHVAEAAFKRKYRS